MSLATGTRLGPYEVTAQIGVGGMARGTAPPTRASSASDADTPRKLVWVDRSGREEVIPASPRPYYTPRLSPDGSRVVLFANDVERDQWVWEFRRATLTRLTATAATELFGVMDARRTEDRVQLRRRGNARALWAGGGRHRTSRAPPRGFRTFVAHEPHPRTANGWSMHEGSVRHPTCTPYLSTAASDPANSIALRRRGVRPRYP
jgi:hypothetical protein